MRLFTCLTAAAALLATACDVTVKTDSSNEAGQTAASQPAQQQTDPYAANPEAIARARQLAAQAGSEDERRRLREQGRAELANLRVVVDISERELRLLDGDRVIETHAVAVGSEEWPTPTGSWEFHRVDINPEWIPPKSEEWAKDETRKAPGDPENPMGRARLVYRMPNTVHGTDDLNSLGKAVSHGSIRVANAVALDLAEKLLKAGDAWDGPNWFKRMTESRTTEYQIDLSDTVPIQVQE